MNDEKEEALGRSGGSETSVQEPALSKAGQPRQVPWGRETRVAGDYRQREAGRETGTKVCARHTRPCRFYSRHTWGTAIVRGVYAGE